MRFGDFVNDILLGKSQTNLKEWQPEPGMHVLLVTGQLAQKGLKRIMDAIDPTDFTYEIRVLDVAVAAWISNEMILEQIEDFSGVDLLLVPGKLIGDEQVLSERIGIPVVRGPNCYSELPVFLEIENFEDISSDDIVRPRIAIIGPSTSKNRNIARILSKTYEVPFLTQANMLRRAVEDGETVGAIAKGFQNKNQPIPPNIRASVVNNRLLDDDTAGFVLADYPTTARDAQWIQDLSIDIDIVIFADSGRTPTRSGAQLLDYYQDDPKLLKVNTQQEYKPLVTELLTRIEQLMQQCVIPDSGKAERPK